MKPREEGGVVDGRLNVYGMIRGPLYEMWAKNCDTLQSRYPESQVCRLEYLPGDYIHPFNRICVLNIVRRTTWARIRTRRPYLSVRREQT